MSRVHGARALTVGVAFLHLTCGQAILTAPVGSEIFVTANPGFIPANGGVSIISALVIEPAGTPVPDGTVVQFFTSLGRIEEQGRTNDGVARVKLVSDSRSGTAKVRAFAGPTEATAELTIGTANVAQIIVRADPNRISANSSSTEVIATVFDIDGNPVPNVPVFFSTCGGDSGNSADTVDPTGPVFTNNNGEARTTLRTRRSISGSACVKAQVPGKDAQVLIPVVR